MASVEEILARSKGLRGVIPSFKKQKRSTAEPVGEYVEPPLNKFIHRKYFEVLAPVGFEWADCIISFYRFELTKTQINDMLLYRIREFGHTTVIIHGHERDEGCSLPAQCHVLRYRPLGDEPKPFLENWKKFGYSE